MVFKLLCKFFFMLLFVVFCCVFLMYVVESKSIFIYIYFGRLDSEEKVDVILQVKVKVIEIWIVIFQLYQECNFFLVKDDIIENIDEYLFSSVVVLKDNNKDIKQYWVVVWVDINDIKLLNYLMVVGRVKDGSMDDEDQYIMFVFVVREFVL